MMEGRLERTQERLVTNRGDGGMCVRVFVRVCASIHVCVCYGVCVLMIDVCVGPSAPAAGLFYSNSPCAACFSAFTLTIPRLERLISF